MHHRGILLALGLSLATNAYLLLKKPSSHTESLSESPGAPVIQTAGTTSPTNTFERAKTSRTAVGEVSQKTGTLADELDALLSQAKPLGEPLTVIRLSELSNEEIPDAFEYLVLQQKYGTATTDMWHAFWMRWGALDPEAALAQSEEFVPRYDRSERRTLEIIKGFASQSPEAAAQYLLDHPDLHDRPRAAEGLGGEWAKHDPGAATQFALTELEGDAQKKALFAIPYGISRTYGYQATIDWFNELPDNQQRDQPFRALAHIYGTSAKTTPEEMLGVAEAGIASGYYDAKILNHIALVYGELDPQIGIDLFSRVAQTTGSGYQAFTPLLRTWVDIDPVAAGEWVGTQVEEPWINHAIYGIAKGLERSDPEAAKLWLEQVPEDLRNRAEDPFARY